MIAASVCGLTFGDEGKGTITDLLTRRLGARAVVRWNGGPQAGHNVVAPDGRWHCFAQLGAGSFVPGTRTLLAPGMLVELEALAVEIEVLAGKRVADVARRVVVDPDCALVTPMHKLVGQLEELRRGADRRGSCGMGVGEAARERDRGGGVRVRDVMDGGPARERLAELASQSLARARMILDDGATPEMAEIFAHFRERCAPEVLYRRYREILVGSGLTVAPVAGELGGSAAVVLEGAQGALLDGQRGFVPYVTQSRTTFHGAAALAADAGMAAPLRVGVLRAHAHRHGAGPLVTEDPALRERFADPRNPTNRWQGPFRTGELDLLSLRLGVGLNEGADILALTHLDRLGGLETVRLCTAYEYRGDLAPLDRHFQWERLGGGAARVLAIRVPAAGTQRGGELAALLGRCRPREWLELPGWHRSLAGVRAFADLPRAARALIDHLAGESGLGVPVGIVSVGPGADEKLVSAEAME